MDIPGNHTLAECSRVLAPRGIYVLIGHDQFGRSAGAWLGSLPRFFKLLVLSPFTNHLPELNVALPDKRESMARLVELIEAGKLTPVVDRAFPLHEARDALRYLERGSARGRVVLSV